MLEALREREHTEDVPVPVSEDQCNNPRSRSRSRSRSSPIQRYFQISNAGHCPNHEAPGAVGYVVRAWTGATDRTSAGGSLLPEVGCNSNSNSNSNSNNGGSEMGLSFVEEWADPGAPPQILQELDASVIPRSWADAVVARFL